MTALNALRLVRAAQGLAVLAIIAIPVGNALREKYQTWRLMKLFKTDKYGRGSRATRFDEETMNKSKDEVGGTIVNALHAAAELFGVG
jgi:hypothetical protein